MEEVISKIKEHKIVSIIRLEDSTQIELIVDRLYKSGIRIVEVTLNTPNAFEMISAIKNKYTDMIVGAGTVLDEVDVKLAIDSGANFLLSPILDENSIRVANKHNVLMVPGVFTPTEALRAYEYGARMVKLFPARNLKADFISDLKGPLNQIDVMAVGGITLENGADFLSKGSCSLGIGSAIVNNKDIEEENFEKIEEKAREFVVMANQK